MNSKTPSEAPPTPSEVSFSAFRKRIASDKKLAESIKKATADTPANEDLLAALTKAVEAMNAP